MLFYVLDDTQIMVSINYILFIYLFYLQKKKERKRDKKRKGLLENFEKKYVYRM